MIWEMLVWTIGNNSKELQEVEKRRKAMGLNSLWKLLYTGWAERNDQNCRSLYCKKMHMFLFDFHLYSSYKLMKINNATNTTFRRSFLQCLECQTSWKKIYCSITSETNKNRLRTYKFFLNYFYVYNALLEFGPSFSIQLV